MLLWLFLVRRGGGSGGGLGGGGRGAGGGNKKKPVGTAILAILVCVAAKGMASNSLV